MIWFVFVGVFECCYVIYYCFVGLLLYYFLFDGKWFYGEVGGGVVVDEVLFVFDFILVVE